VSRHEARPREEREVFDQLKLRHADELFRIGRWQAEVEDRRLLVDRRAEEVDQAVKQLTRDAMELEEHTRLAEAEHQRLTAESSRLERLRLDLEEREIRLGERSAQTEAQQASLLVLRARLDREHEQLNRE